MMLYTCSNFGGNGLFLFYINTIDSHTSRETDANSLETNTPFISGELKTNVMTIIFYVQHQCPTGTYTFA